MLLVFLERLRIRVRGPDGSVPVPVYGRLANIAYQISFQDREHNGLAEPRPPGRRPVEAR